MTAAEAKEHRSGRAVLAWLFQAGGDAATGHVNGSETRVRPAADGKDVVFVVRRFADRGLLADLIANLAGTLHRPGQVDQVCRRENLTGLVAESRRCDTALNAVTEPCSSGRCGAELWLVGPGLTKR